MMENYLYIMYNQINKAMQKIMRSLFIATLLLVSMGMGAYAAGNKKDIYSGTAGDDRFV